MNKLKFETSPYLLQHAENPVNWFAWKPEAFEKAQNEDKPILVSIGYSTCHWCHVMEKESFEDPEVAKIMNEHFVNIKVDREERPDIDQIYMEACQAMTGSGGWPLNCFLLPDGRPFFAGTYYPPNPAYNRPSWTQVLVNVNNAFVQKREIVEDQANRLTKIVKESEKVFLEDRTGADDLKEEAFSSDALIPVFEQLKHSFDKQWGGFGGAPKFPGTMLHEFLLDYYFFTGTKEAIDHVGFSLNQMIMGGIYDQIGGGFARYSTDNKWLVPHFEKMLYDNALLLGIMSDYLKVKNDEVVLEAIENTVAFIQREMTSPEGGFYSALDADSEGIEGKYYLWDWEVFSVSLGKEANIFAPFFGVSEIGFWEGTNILYRPQTEAKFAEENGLDPFVFKEKLETIKSKLLAWRVKRIPPSLDDKIILGWNALLSTGLIKAYKATGKITYRDMAQRNVDFILEKFKNKMEGGLSLHHTYKDGVNQYNAFLDDYAFLIQALIELYQVTLDTRYLDQANAYCQFTIKNFLDPETNLFYFTNEHQEDILFRKKEYYDSAIPSGNSTMALNLYLLSKFFNENKYQKLASQMIRSFQKAIGKYPSSFGRWARVWLHLTQQSYEVAVVGDEYKEKVAELSANYWPNMIIMADVEGNDQYPILAKRKGKKPTKIYICQNYACQLPVEDTKEAIKMVLPEWIIR